MDHVRYQRALELAESLHNRCVQVRTNGGDVSSDLEAERLAESYRKYRGLPADYGVMLLWGNAQNILSSNSIDYGNYGNSGTR